MVPHRYTLALEPDLAGATFTGHVIIDLNVNEPAERIVLNAIELDIADPDSIQRAAARLIHRGDTVIVIAYEQLPEREAAEVAPRKVFVDSLNRIVRVEIGDGSAHRVQADMLVAAAH